MSNLPKSKKPIFLALGDSTIRIDPRSSITAYLPIQIIQPPEYNDEGHWMRDGKVIQLWMSMEDAKLFADAIYAQESLNLVDPQ